MERQDALFGINIECSKGLENEYESGSQCFWYEASTFSLCFGSLPMSLVVPLVRRLKNFNSMTLWFEGSHFGVNLMCYGESKGKEN